MKEENEEYLEAVQNDNLIEIADALGDMMYILCGTIIEHGLQHKIEAVLMKFNENMSKLDHSGNPYIGRTGR
jgi:predicted HAD superfamily Cof-like phosphohydrolase